VLSRADARRVAIRAQLLNAPRPTDLIAVVERLTLIQVDPTSAVAPSIDLIPYTRLGPSYRPEHMRWALERDFTLFEFNGMVRPMSDLCLYLAEMRLWPEHDRARHWLEANDPFRRDILDRLEAEGPQSSREIPDTSIVPWQSSGWTNNRNVTQMLEFLMMRGEVAIAGRRNGQRLWDLAERVYPDVVEVPRDEARRIRAQRRLRSLGIVRENAPDTPNEPGTVGEAGERATVEGVPGVWRHDPTLLDQSWRGRTVLLSPYDRLVYNRARLMDLFGFEYYVEMYKPKAARRWGYYALPILHHDRFVGKVDATADRPAGILRVDAIHEDVPFTAAMRSATAAELDALATWLGLAVSRSAYPA
jgi:hypothetical protein